jgi:mannose-6-phosphate isomerase-like protein (cupin superfamily)
MTHQSFTVNELTALADGHAYREFLRRPAMSLGLYRLAVGGTDTQHPHSSDEIYIVQQGRALLVVEGTAIEVGPGAWFPSTRAVSTISPTSPKSW